MGDKDDLVLAGGQFAINEAVALLDLYGNDAAFADVLEIVEVRFLHDAAAGGEDDVEIFVPGFLIGFLALDADGCGDFLLGAEFQEVGDGPTLAGAGALGNFKNAFDVAASALGDEEQVIVRRGREKEFDEIAVLFLLGLAGRHTNHPLATTLLGAVGTDEGAFDEAVVGQCDDNAFVGDEVLDGHLAFGRNDLGAAFGGVLFLQFAQFVGNDFENALFLGQDIQEVFDGFD